MFLDTRLAQKRKKRLSIIALREFVESSIGYEPMLYGWKEGTDHDWCGARNQGYVWFIDKPHANDVHPTMKPVALVERSIRNRSKTRDTVLDPFTGSGTTLIA